MTSQNVHAPVRRDWLEPLPTVELHLHDARRAALRARIVADPAWTE